MSSTRTARGPRPVHFDQPVPRCPHPHHDFTALARHVVDDFPDVALEEVAADLRVAREAVTTAQLGDDALEVAEIIVRHRLLIRTGAIPDVARVDPQVHPPRRAE